jgi:hypothetical protein
MTENVYAGILDESRMKIAVSMDNDFFKDIKEPPFIEQKDKENPADGMDKP